MFFLYTWKINHFTNACFVPEGLECGHQQSQRDLVFFSSGPPISLAGLISQEDGGFAGDV